MKYTQYYISFITIIATTNTLNTMYKITDNITPLSPIERRLVLHQIDTRGLDLVLREIQNTPAPEKRNHPNMTEYFHYPALRFNMILTKPQSINMQGPNNKRSPHRKTEKGTLVYSIFKKIKTIETIDNKIKGFNEHTNYIGEGTRYYWLQHTTPMVTITSQINNVVALYTIIEEIQNRANDSSEEY